MWTSTSSIKLLRAFPTLTSYIVVPIGDDFCVSVNLELIIISCPIAFDQMHNQPRAQSMPCMLKTDSGMLRMS